MAYFEIGSYNRPRPTRLDHHARRCRQVLRESRVAYIRKAVEGRMVREEGKAMQQAVRRPTPILAMMVHIPPRA